MFKKLYIILFIENELLLWLQAMKVVCELLVLG